MCCIHSRLKSFGLHCSPKHLSLKRLTELVNSWYDGKGAKQWPDFWFLDHEFLLLSSWRSYRKTDYRRQWRSCVQDLSVDMALLSTFDSTRLLIFRIPLFFVHIAFKQLTFSKQFFAAKPQNPEEALMCSHSRAFSLLEIRPISWFLPECHFILLLTECR